MKNKDWLLGVANFLSKKSKIDSIWIRVAIFIFLSFLISLHLTFFTFIFLSIYFVFGLYLQIMLRKKCGKCNQKIDKGKKFCGNCGKKVSPIVNLFLRAILTFFIIIVLIGASVNDAKTDDEQKLQGGILPNESIRENVTINFTEETNIPQEVNTFNFSQTNSSNITEKNFTTYISPFTYKDIRLLSNLEEVNASLCGLSTGNLIVCFGNPLYAIGWERSSTGQNLEPNSYKFLFNNYSIITKGKYNSATKLIETYQILIREDGENSTLIKNIQCEKK